MKTGELALTKVEYVMRYRLTGIVLLALACSPSLTFAQDTTRVLILAPGLCEHTKTMLAKWSMTVTPNAALALPSDPATTCDDPNPPKLTAGIASGAQTLEEAAQLAEQTCEASRDPSLGNCVVIGRLTLQ